MSVVIPIEGFRINITCKNVCNYAATDLEVVVNYNGKHEFLINDITICIDLVARHHEGM